MIRRLINRLKIKHRYKNCIINSEFVEGVLGQYVCVGRESVVSKRVHIGDFTKIGGWTEIQSGSIGKFCAIGDYCSIGGAEHPAERRTMSAMTYLKSMPLYTGDYDEYTQPPVIGNDVWICNHVNVLQGVHIGDGAIIAAGSVVTKDVPAYTVWGGVPAHHIKYRFSPKVIDKLSKDSFWRHDARFYLDNKHLLSQRMESVGKNNEKDD